MTARKNNVAKSVGRIVGNARKNGARRAARLARQGQKNLLRRYRAAKKIVIFRRIVAAYTKASPHIMRAAVVVAGISRFIARHSWRVTRFAHHHVAHRPHVYLSRKWAWYERWHRHPYHNHVHAGTAAVSFLVACVVIVFQYGNVRALSDLLDNWDFTDGSGYLIDGGLETSGSSVRMKAQNYMADANTAALYHLDEASGTTASDSSANANNATVSNGAFTTGNLNNGLSLNGTNARATVADSASLSLSQDNTLEAWTKFSTTLGAGTHDRKQGVLDKGAYKLYYDQETGKVTYELANSSANTWSQQAGNDIKGSWDLNGKLAIASQVAIGSNIYVGLGNAAGDAEVWKWNGTVWSQIGGDGRNASWADLTYENVSSLAANGTTLYAGLGLSTGDAEVWSCDTTTNCAAWTKIGGDGINSGWAVNVYEDVSSMTVMGGSLYVGLGNSANDARVYRWNGSSWTWVGGFGIGAPYNAFTTGYELIYRMTNDGTNLYVGFGNSIGDADVWRLTGTTWTQIGGDTLNTSWAASTYEYVGSLDYYGGNLYAGLGSTAGDGEVWRWNGTAWTQIGGDTLNSSWDATSYEMVYGLVNDGTNLYAGLGNTAGDNEVWSWNGTAWTKIGGDGINSGFTTTHTAVQSMVYANGTLYAGNTASGTNAEEWSWNGTAWTKIGGGYINKSWGFYNLQNVESMTVSGDYLYAGTGNTVAGNALVWRFDGSTWTMIGGQGINSSWAAGTYEDVMSMVSYGGNLYVGLGTTANDAEVWRWNGTAWTQVGGDSLNSGWTAGYEEVWSMAAYGGNLYAGLGNSANDAEVWRWNGTTWLKIGGDSSNSGWTTNYERVSSLTVFDGNLYAGLGSSANDAEVWRWNGTTWLKIGGDSLNSSWNTVYEQVESLISYDGQLYAGLGNSTGDAEVWRWNGTAWTQVGGDGLNSSWIDGQYEQAKSFTVYNGTLFVGLGNSMGDGEVWAYDSGTWTKIGGGVNGGWAANVIESVRSFSVYHGKLYAGLGDSANADASIWSYGSNGFLQSTTVGQDTNWHHVAATYDGTTMKLFIDGTQDASTAVSLSIPDTSQPLSIGSMYGVSETGWGQGYFAGMLDEVRISNIARSSSALTVKPYSTARQSVTLAAAAHTSGVWSWDNFANTTSGGGAVTFRLSDDGGVTWKYWNGVAWAASTDTSQASSASIVDTHISAFPITFAGITWQAVLAGDGSQRVSLDAVSLYATSDTSPPLASGITISALKAAGGSALASNGWTNGGSPYFSWNAGSDSESGVKGYCAYLGTDNTADPATTKGMLGNSPVGGGGHCQFVVGGTSLDLSTAGYLATTLTTRNDPYYLVLKTIDNAGNVSNDSVQFAFRFDNTPPTNPGFITAPSGFVNDKGVTLTWPTSGGSAPSDANSGFVGMQYRVGASGTWYGDSHTGTGDTGDLLTNDGTYTMLPTPDFPNLAEGINTIYFRSWDTAGNATTSYATAAIKINTSGAPSEPQNVIATPSTNTTNAFSFHWDSPVTFVGDAANLTYCYTINTLPSASNCTFTSAGVTSLGAGPYATQPGENTFYVVARDESNNVNYASYASVTFAANTTAPGMPRNTDIVDVSIKSTSSWRLALTWDQPTSVGAGVASYKVYRSINNVTFNLVGSSSSTTYIDAGLTQQTYYYKVAACDSTNNCGAYGTVVSGYPTGKFTSPALLVSGPKAENITTKKATITWSTDRGSDSRIAIGTTSGKYSASEISGSDQVSAHSVAIDNLSAGTTYYYIAKWTDGDGNIGISQEGTFTTLPPPTLKEITATSITLSSATIRFASKDAHKVAIYYGPSEAFGGVQSINTSSVESTYSVNLPSLSDGTKYFYKLVAYDDENNAYEGSIASFATPPRPRITNLTFQPVNGEPTSTQQVTWTTNVPSTSTVTYGKEGTIGTDIQESQLVTDHKIVISNLEDNSQYFLVAQSRDADGNVAVSDRQVFHTALDTRPPKISDVVVEASIRGTGAEARGQLVVSWRTDEPATSQVAYGEGSNSTTFNSKTSEDTGLGTEHIVIVSDLPTSKVYSIKPLSHDKANNLGAGEPQSAIIGRASDSVLTIILNSLQKVFGF